MVVAQSGGFSPVACPWDHDLWLISWAARVELSGVIILRPIRKPRRAVRRLEMGPVEITGEELANAPTERRARVDTDEQQPSRTIHVRSIKLTRRRRIRVFQHRYLDEVGALVLQAQQTSVGEIASERPVARVGRGVEGHDVVLRESDGHDPAGRGGVPEDFRVAEVGVFDIQDGVGGVFGEGVAIVGAICEGLLLHIRCRERVDGDHAGCGRV